MLNVKLFVYHVTSRLYKVNSGLRLPGEYLSYRRHIDLATQFGVSLYSIEFCHKGKEARRSNELQRNGWKERAISEV